MKTVVLMRVVIDTAAEPTAHAVAYALEDALNDRTWKKVAIGLVPHGDSFTFDEMFVGDAHVVAYHPGEPS